MTAKKTLVSAEVQARLRQEAERDGIEKFVVGAFIERDGKVLILRRSPKESYLAGLHEIPSGGVEPGEGLLDGLVREVREETGLIVKEVRRFANSFDYRSGSGKLTRQLNFLVEVEYGDVTTNPLEHDDALWVHPASDDFAHLNLSAETRACLLQLAGC